MDIAELLSGFHTIDPLGPDAARKRTAFEVANRLGGGSQEDADAFIAGVPSALSRHSLSSDSIDNHMSALLAIALNGHKDADTFTAAAIHALVLQLTYQGRHRPDPEAYVLGKGGDTRLGETGLLNTYGVAAYCLDETYTASNLASKTSMALTRGEFRSTSAAGALGDLTAHNRLIGCMAFIDVGANAAIDAQMIADLNALRSRTTSETFYLLAGQAASVARLYEWITAYQPHARVVVRFYWHTAEAAEEFRGILIVSGLPFGLDLSEADLEGPNGFEICDLEAILSDPERSDVKEILVRDLERVRLRVPTVVSTSAPLSEEQAARISDSAAVRHLVLKLDNGRVVDSRSRAHSTYVIMSGRDEIVADYQELGAGAFEASPYFAPIPEAGHPRLSPKRDRRPTREVRGPCLLLTFHPTVHNFHSHFLLQCFPRIQLMKHMGVSDYKILAPYDLKKYQVEMLSLAGVDPSRIVRMNPAYDYVAEVLYVPKLLPAFFTPLYAEVYDELIQTACPEPTIPFRRIIISREARTTWRNMFSFDSVAQLLIDDHGFEMVSPDKLSIEDEIRLFREAEIVVGAEGAGLYNCCFMSPGSHVVCLADQDYVMPIIGSMAFIRDFSVSYVFGESFMADSDRSRRAGHANFIVDPARVSAVVAEIVARS